MLDFYAKKTNSKEVWRVILDSSVFLIKLMKIMFHKKVMQFLKRKYLKSIAIV